MLIHYEIHFGLFFPSQEIKISYMADHEDSWGEHHPIFG